MLKNYFKVAMRNLLKRKVYTAINILGLATGMAVCMLIVLFVQSELGYDKHHENGDNIYRVVLDRNIPVAPLRTPSYRNPSAERSRRNILKCWKVQGFTISVVVETSFYE